MARRAESSAGLLRNLKRYARKVISVMARIMALLPHCGVTRMA
jgi:hypothetical protein